MSVAAMTRDMESSLSESFEDDSSSRSRRKRATKSSDNDDSVEVVLSHMDRPAPDHTLDVPSHEEKKEVDEVVGRQSLHVVLYRSN